MNKNSYFKAWLLAILLLLTFKNGLYSQCSPSNPATLAVSGGSWAQFGAWGLSSTNPINLNLEILAGTSLDLDGTDLYLAEGISIAVRPGGRLTLRNCKLNSCDPEKLWSGIFINGDPSLPSNHSGQAKLGAVNSTFTNIQSGIMTGGLIRGGWMYVENCEFINPGLQALAIYTQSEQVPVVVRNNSFKNYRPYVPFTVWAGNVSFIVSDYTCGVTIEENSFENFIATAEGTFLDPRCGGIYLRNSNLNIKGNTFTHLDYGVKMVACFAGYCTGERMKIRENTFTNNHVSIYANRTYVPDACGIYIANNNFINDEQYETGPDYTGPGADIRYFLWLHESHRNHIEGNTFIKTETESTTKVPFPFECIKIDHSNHAALRRNQFTFGITPGGTLFPATPNPQPYVASNTALAISNVDDLLLECNAFNLDPNSNQSQFALNITDCPLINEIAGAIGQGSRNSFNQSPTNCGGSFRQVSVLGTTPGLNWPAINSFPDPLTSCSSPGKLLLQPGAADNDCASSNRHFDEYPASPYKAMPEAAEAVLQLYPNPALGGRVQLALAPAAAEIKLIGLDGQCLRVWSKAHGLQKMSLDLEGLPAGLYFVKAVSIDGQRTLKKLIIQ